MSCADTRLPGEARCSELVLSGLSCPTLAAAKHFGISTDYAFLIADGFLATEGRGVWPAGHYWHGWAASEAANAHGVDACYSFARAMYAHQQAVAHG